MTDEPAQATPPRRRLLIALKGAWTARIFEGVLVGVILLLVTPLVTGFANLTFSTKSWETFGTSNEAGTPGSYLSPDAVYELPLDERFRIEGGFLLSVSRFYGDPYATVTATSGRSKNNRISASSSLSAENDCERVAVHLMRQPAEGETTFFIMYTSQWLDDEKCKGILGGLFN
jgi:hypothetical protein